MHSEKETIMSNKKERKRMSEMAHKDKEKIMRERGESRKEAHREKEKIIRKRKKEEKIERGTQREGNLQCEREEEKLRSNT